MTDAADLQFAPLSGTREAMVEVERPTISITIPEMNAQNLGALIALFERAVGITAELLDINAYDQPGVEAGKEGREIPTSQMKAAEIISEKRHSPQMRLRTLLAWTLDCLATMRSPSPKRKSHDNCRKSALERPFRAPEK